MNKKKHLRKGLSLSKAEYKALIKSGFTIKEYIETIPMQMDDTLTVMRSTGVSYPIIEIEDVDVTDNVLGLLLELEYPA